MELQPNQHIHFQFFTEMAKSPKVRQTRESSSKYFQNKQAMEKMEHPKGNSSKHNHNPHFFKFLFPDPFTKQLHIPNNFYKHLPGKPPKRAALVIQRGKFWEVEVCQKDEGICFGRGWPEFAKAHNLRKGYFVVFRYEGNMVFNVEIFDTTCCLKAFQLTPSEPPTFNFEASMCVDLTSDVNPEVDTQVPIASGEKKKNASRRVVLIDKEDKEQRKQNLKGRVRKEKILKSSSDKPPVPQFEKALDPYSTNKFRPSFESSKFVALASDVNPEVDSQVPVASGGKRKNISDKVQLIDKEDREQRKQLLKSRAIKEKIRKSRSDTLPVPWFEKTLNRFSTTKCRPCLTIPKCFCIENGLVSEQTIFLMNSEEEKWPVNFCIRKDVGTLAKGWRAFSMENGLNEDNKCIFQLVNKNTFLVKAVENQ